MECENENETKWTRQIGYSQFVKVSLFQSRIEDFQLLSQQNVRPGKKNDGPTLDQRWINGGSMMDQ